MKNERMRNESELSLDLRFGDMKESIGSYLFPVQGDFVKSIILWEYVKYLGEEKIYDLEIAVTAGRRVSDYGKNALVSGELLLQKD